MDGKFDDWRPAPNIGSFPEIYELENEAIARDGRLDAGLLKIADWTGKTLLDVGCGTGFWLPRYAELAGHVIGIEPDPALYAAAAARVVDLANAEALEGSAEHLPLPDDAVDIVHARFAYFFGNGAERGLDEVRRVLRPDGVFVAVDNAWHDDDFGKLLRLATEGNAAIDPDATRAWWEARGARRIDVEGAWACANRDELDMILRIEFAADVVDRFMAEYDGAGTLSYGFALYVWKA